jgi:hypothetical protein
MVKMEKVPFFAMFAKHKKERMRNLWPRLQKERISAVCSAEAARWSEVSARLSSFPKRTYSRQFSKSDRISWEAIFILY